MILSERFQSYLSRYYAALTLGVICILLTNMAKLCGPYILGHAVDDLAHEITKAKLTRYGLMLVLVALAQGLFFFFQQRAFIHVSRSFESRLRSDYYAHLQKLPTGFYQKFRTGDLMARATNDLTMVRMLASAGVMYAVNTIFVLLLLIPLMFSINWLLALLTLALMPLIAVATQSFSKHIHERAISVQASVVRLANLIQESLSSVRVTRAYRQERSQVAAFEGLSRECVEQNIKLARLSGMFTPTLQTIVQVGALGVLCFGGGLVVSGTLSIGHFVQFMLYLGLLVYPMIELGGVITLFQRARVSMSRIDEVMSAKIPRRGSGKASAPVVGEIEFRGVTFTYPGAGEPALKEVSFRIPAGGVAAILGPVGSGKSTLLNIIPRLLEPDSGEVLLDGRDVRELPIEELRAAIGYVPQESFLFSRSIADNIAFGGEGASEEEIRRAAADAELAGAVEKFQNGWETVVGERGATLSGGQRQRLAIARALVRQPRILLLDDALSSVDINTERSIMRNLRRVARNCTTVLTSHRTSSLRDADLIVVMQDWRIVEHGTHEKLLELGGYYARIHRMQALEEELVVI